MKGWIICVSSLFAVAHGIGIEIGKEFKYDVVIKIGAGTMDHAPSSAGKVIRLKARIQAPEKETIRGEIGDITFAEYVGPFVRNMNPALNYLPMPGPQTLPFEIKMENGLFKSLSMPSGLTLTQKNVLKAWVSIFQLDLPKKMAGKKSFRSTEETLFGACDVSYTVASGIVYKTTVHNQDCKNFVQRRVDNVRGHDCEGNEDVAKGDGITSTSTTIYELEGEGDNRKFTKIQTRGAFVSQLYDTEGFSHIAHANITAVLTSESSDPGDISGWSETTNTLQYEFADNDYKWNQDRNLKDADPFFSSGFYLEDQDLTKKAVLKWIGMQKEVLHDHELNPEGIKKAHDYGINNLLRLMVVLNYDSLKSIFDQLMSDSSTEGKMKSNMFTELLGSTGTTASAMLIMDLLKAKKFDNQRDAARVLTAIPFHIRRSNKQLVQQFKELLESDQEEAVKMALPLSYAHLVRMTCERAGHNFRDPEIRECAEDLGAETAEYFFKMYKDANDRKMKNLYMGALKNLRWGGLSKLLKPMIYGKTDDGYEQRTFALWAVVHEIAHTGKGFDYLFPVFAERKNHHEIRMSAAAAIMGMYPSSDEIAKIVAILSTEKDFEIINGVFSLLKKKADSISPCDRKIKKIAGFFLKYLKQFSKYEVDTGFGVTKVYERQFDKKKYGYGGSYSYYVIGGHDSTTPLSLGMGINSYVHSSYQVKVFKVHLRIEGLAKSLIRKFKTSDPTLWKTGDLKSIFTQMGIKERSDQPLRASVSISFKGVIVILRSYDDSETQEGGKLKNFMDQVQNLGNDYLINHQRVLNVGNVIIEQPTVVGIPVAKVNYVTTMMSLEAKLNRGQNRGTFFGEVEYDLHLFTQAMMGIYVLNPANKRSYGISQNRVYHSHLPGKLSVGVNPLKKNLKVKVFRAKYDEPTMFMMHAQTSVGIRSLKSIDPEAGIEDLKQSCPSCPSMMLVSNGDPREREILSRDNSKYGFRVDAKYFDCEMDIKRTNTIGRALGAFMPYNKSPRTLWTMLTMGMRQIRAFLFYFPRAEKCGVLARYSQSSQNPVREIEIEVGGSRETKSERLFLRGALTKFKIGIRAIGDQTRAYRLSLQRLTSPGDLKISTKIKFDRAKNDALGIQPYVICFMYKANYPRFSKEMFDVDMNSDMKMEGEAKLQYGEQTKCEKGEGEIEAKFEYSTTQEARETLKKKWYYKDCMEKKNSKAWQGRNGLPVSHSCYLTAFDASNARQFMCDVKFNKLTDRAKSIIGNIRSVVRTFLLPYLESDDASNGEIGPFMKMKIMLKEDDKVADVVLETSQGTRKFDFPLSRGIRLRNLKFTKTYEMLRNNGIIKPCQLTSKYVQTMDNVTYPLETPSCWTLMSGHCGPTPSYAVFVKKDSGKPLAMKAYIGGHLVEIDANSKSVKVNGGPISVDDTNEYKHEEAGVEVLKITKWGTTFNIYSFMRVWVMFDGIFVNVVPAPSVKGQHCGLCGNYNRNQWDEAIGKDGATNVGFSGIADEWKWQC